MAARKLVSVWLLVLQVVAAIEVDWNSTDSIKAAASTMAYDMMTFYKGNLTGNEPGLLALPPAGYYWWEAGAMFGALVNYWYYTGDTTYNEVTMQAMQYQVGEFQDYMPQEQRSSLGNDDQAFWAIAALQAVEYNFPNPPPDKPSWLGLVQAVFNEQIGRWDNATCGGGLRWQIYMKGGYNLKNTISNGCLFNIAARLARYTGEKKYSDWAVKLWDWMWDIGLINHDTYSIYDNSEADIHNCTELDRHEWSYNPAVLLFGAATMYNHTEDPVWRNRTTNLLTRIEQVFFPNTTMTELCEFYGVCNTDQLSFKAYLARWMTSTTQLANFTYPTVIRLLSNSAKEAAAQCIGGESGTKCGIKWWLNGTWDGTNGVGQQMSALETTLGTLIRVQEVKPPVTNTTGGTSQPKPDAGHDFTSNPSSLNDTTPPKKKDVIAAWFLTVLIALSAIASVWFMTSLFLEDEGNVKKGEAEKTGTLAAVFDRKGKRVAKNKDAQRKSVSVLEPVNEEDASVPRYRGGTMVT